MTDAQVLRDRWNKSPRKAEWDAVLRSPAWAEVSALIEEEAIEYAESYLRMEGDPILARNLAWLKGVRESLRKLSRATEPEPQPITPPQEYEHIEPAN
jgi:hypothetical protein